jgi:uncharacterized membrane protein YoaK (UPF0700 family)
MIRFDRRIQLFAVCLSAVAGYVDAIGFLKLGGFFVSFMSGNSTRLGVGLVTGTPSAPMAASLIAFFVLGVMLGTIVGALIRIHRTMTLLAIIAIFIACAALLSLLGLTVPGLFLVAMAMGMENAVFAIDGEVRIGVTYMTGTLVKFGQGVALARLGRKGRVWAPYLMLWCGLLFGATCGAAAFNHFELQGLWLAAAVLCGLAIVSSQIEQTAFE